MTPSNNLKNFVAMDKYTSLVARTKNVQQPIIKAPLTSKFAGDSSFNIKIVASDTASPEGSFPVVLFASAHEASDYVSLLKNIPSGYTLVISETANSGNKVFTYTSGGNVRSLTVSSNTAPYTTILSSMLVNRVGVTTTRIAVTPSTNAAAQYGEAFEVVSQNIFGKTNNNPIDIELAQDPQNFQTNIIEVNQAYEINQNQGILLFVEDSTTQLNITMTTSNYALV